MTIGHDITIKINFSFKSYFYRDLITYIGINNNKIYKKESDYKNGIRIIQDRCNINVSRKKIKKLIQTRDYGLSKYNYIVLDMNVTSSIYETLLSELNKINQQNVISNLLIAYFDLIKNDNELYSKRLTIFETIYRELLADSNINENSACLCSLLKETDSKFPKL